MLLVVDLGAGAHERAGEPPVTQLRMLRAELAAYDASLLERPALVVGTKLDLPGAATALAGLRRSATATGKPRPLGVSAATGEGVEELRAAVSSLSEHAQRLRVM